MTDDSDDLPVPAPLHPRDLAALQRRQDDRLEELMAAIRGAPLRPPGNTDTPMPRGIDAYVIQQTVQGIIDGKIAGFLTREQIRILADERLTAEDNLKRLRAIVDERLMADENVKRFLRLVDDRLGHIGLRMDDDHIDATGDAIRGAVKWHRLASRMWVTALTTVGLGLLYEVLKKLGLPIPTGT